jgi:RNA polymerase sigma-70 factor (ECF subfamily)
MAEDPSASAASLPPSLDLQALAERHGDHLLRSAYLMCGDESEAQDLVQETFLQAHKSAHRFRGDSSIYTWLFGILRNLCHRHLRKQKRFLFEESLISSQAGSAEPEPRADIDFCAQKLAEALQRLSTEHREVIVLRYYENLKIDEIASCTGASPGTVKSRLHYAVRHLQQLLPRELNLFASADTHYQAAP